MFQDTFHNMIAQLLYTFPHDHKTEAGQLFWSGLKRLPKILDYDPQDPLHADFIYATANLFAFIFRLDPITDKEDAAKRAAKIEVHTFNPKKMVIKESDLDTKVEKAEDDETRIDELTQLLSST